MKNLWTPPSDALDQPLQDQSWFFLRECRLASSVKRLRHERALLGSFKWMQELGAVDWEPRIGQREGERPAEPQPGTDSPVTIAIGATVEIDGPSARSLTCT